MRKFRIRSPSLESLLNVAHKATQTAGITMPVTVLKRTTTLTVEGDPMPKLRINQTDEIEAQKAVCALERGDEKAFRAVVDDAFGRYGGVERMLYVLTSHLAKANQ